MIIQLIIVLSDGTLLRGDAEEIKLVPPAITTKTFLFLLKKHILFTYFFRESGGEVEREGEKHGGVRNIHRLPFAAGTWHATQACTLTRNQTCGLWVCRTTIVKPLSHTNQGKIFLLR